MLQLTQTGFKTIQHGELHKGQRREQHRLQLRQPPRGIWFMKIQIMYIRKIRYDQLDPRGPRE